ncbi:hypothetical protein BH11ACT8_BH11ACT8_30020 [soil metagenome]
MDRHRSLHTSVRSVVVALTPAEAWDVVASGEDTRQWYVDAAPFVFRGALDRLVLGPGRRHRPPGRTRRRGGDRVGFCDVVVAYHREHLLVLEARVRAPGRVVLEATVAPHDEGSTGEIAITFHPRGLVGQAYLLADLPARGVVAELTMLDLLTVLRRRSDEDDNRSWSSSVDQV